MGRSGQIRAKYDHLIREFLQDERYQVREDGTIWTRVPLNGRGLQEAWRPCGKKSGEGYVQIRYKGVYLQAHRVVFEKHVGKLHSDLIVDHKDTNRTNNHPENLKMVTQSTNQYYRHERKKRQNVEAQTTASEEREENQGSDLLEGAAQPGDSIEGVPF